MESGVSLKVEAEAEAMKSGFFGLLCVLLLKFSTADNDSTIIRCNFEFSQPTIYACSLGSVIIDDDESQNFIIDVSGHLENQTDADVTKIEIYGGIIPFIVTEFFTTFANVRFLTISNSGLKRIQADAFTNALNLESFVSYRNPLQSIGSNAFSGAINLFDIDLSFNEIENIHETAFSGLHVVEFLNIGANNLSYLHPEVFRSFTNLTYIILANNQLTSIDGELFANNRLLRNVNFQTNQINSIGTSFLDGLDDLLSLNMDQNICVNTHWVITGSTTIETVREDLQQCFENSLPPPTDEVKKFVLELRGSLIIRDENGEEIFRL